MVRRLFPLLLVPAALAAAGPARAWRLDLPDTFRAEGPTVRLAALAGGPVPAAAAEIVVCAGGRPGTAVTVTRRGLLRRLVEARAARGVAFGGARQTVVVFAGGSVAPAALAERVRAAVQPLVPRGADGAPAPWFELELPARMPAAGPDWRVRCLRSEPLAPGRNPVRCELAAPGGTAPFSVTAVLHAYGELATARVRVRRDDPLLPEHFAWEWRDLAGVRGTPVAGRDALAGASAARNLEAGELLLARDLKPTPVVRSGDQVELWLVRGGLAVRTLATARQEGCLGQTIPVRNALTRQLVNARVTGPGTVEWRN